MESVGVAANSYPLMVYSCIVMVWTHCLRHFMKLQNHYLTVMCPQQVEWFYILCYSTIPTIIIVV